ncbi:hypothetical protein KVR01_010876 [Diaporthe batatas]|uniref:uncharacterized protein n=1 Tax=Diaporthe batatas TaxID=748121 RepID=UPI001D03C876|nr:uncharacterized protein KVR01_010876 [Diaporthe batatas]KAG8159215.1 hypothetical protein KVR01_010876 [Diaporthe batatas]
MASPSTLIKFDVCLYKKDDVSYEDFVEWATKVYPVKAKPVIQKHAVKWTQTVNPPHFREPLRHALKTDMGRPGWSIPDYDMVTTYWLHSLDDLRLMTTTPEWAELEVGAQAITNMDKGHFVVGHEIVHFENNS